MTEDELLEQIRATDPDAEIREINGQRVIVTTAIESNVTVYVHPLTMRILNMDVLKLSRTSDKDAVRFAVTFYGGIKRKYGDGAD